MSEALKGEVYIGPSGGLKKPSDWLASEDLPLDRDVEVEIEDVFLHKNVTFEAGRKEPKVAALKFAGKEKQMILNATNRKRMVKMFASDTKLWRKQKIKLYVDPKCRNPAGGPPVCGLRIRINETAGE